MIEASCRPGVQESVQGRKHQHKKGTDNREGNKRWHRRESERRAKQMKELTQA